MARGHPHMVQQSRMMHSPQPSLKHMSYPASPAMSHRMSRQASPHLSRHASPQPIYAPDPYADPYMDQRDQFGPASPMLSGALQNQLIRQASFAPPMGSQFAYNDPQMVEHPWHNAAILKPVPGPRFTKRCTKTLT
ncbi:unnamed protein product [Merluccius merluccius]